jgi:hypothetical protein
MRIPYSEPPRSVGLPTDGALAIRAGVVRNATPAFAREEQDG